MDRAQDAINRVVIMYEPPIRIPSLAIPTFLRNQGLPSPIRMPSTIGEIISGG